MKPAAQENSLTSDFRAQASPEQKRQRQAVKDAANLRNKANRKAIGEWHNESRGKTIEVPFPDRRTH
jgi:hypothetical protein